MKNKQLISSQRYQIQSLLQVDTPKKKIAELIDTFLGSVYREISRNKGKRGYSAAIAQEYCDIRKECHKQKRKLTPSIEKYIRGKITLSQWSPKQICGQAKLISIALVSHERIYRLIREDKMNGGYSLETYPT
jgi:IS30 family transposase